MFIVHARCQKNKSKCETRFLPCCRQEFLLLSTKSLFPSPEFNRPRLPCRVQVGFRACEDKKMSLLVVRVFVLGWENLDNTMFLDVLFRDGNTNETKFV